MKGCKNLAARLGVCEWTVKQWRKRGVLDAATLADFGRVIIFDMEKVYECLHHRTAKPGRPRTY